jgi:hypothetical protein
MNGPGSQAAVDAGATPAESVCSYPVIVHEMSRGVLAIPSLAHGDKTAGAVRLCSCHQDNMNAMAAARAEHLAEMQDLLETYKVLFTEEYQQKLSTVMHASIKRHTNPDQVIPILQHVKVSARSSLPDWQFASFCV